MLKRRWTPKLFLDNVKKAFDAGEVEAEKRGLRVYAAVVVRLQPTAQATEVDMPILCMGRMLNADGPIPSWYDEVTIEAIAFAKAITAMVRCENTPVEPPRQGEPPYKGGVDYTSDGVYIGVSGADDDENDYLVACVVGKVMVNAISLSDPIYAPTYSE